MTQRRPAALLLVLASVAGACGGGGGDKLVLDGRPRHADVEGVVDAVTVRGRGGTLTVDGRRYRLSSDLRAFSTYTLEPIPVAGERGKFVQLGLDGNTVEWLGSVGPIVRAPGTDPVVYYVGRLVKTAGGTLTFRDGTVLRLAPGVRSPIRTGQVRAELDPDDGVVRRVVSS